MASILMLLFAKTFTTQYKPIGFGATQLNRKLKYLTLHEINAKPFLLIFAPAGLARPAPAELPQDRKVARVGGCSGAM